MYQFGSFHSEKRFTLPLKCATAAPTKCANSCGSGLKPSQAYGGCLFPHANAGGSPVRSSWTWMPKSRARLTASSQTLKSYWMFAGTVVWVRWAAGIGCHQRMFIRRWVTPRARRC